MKFMYRIRNWRSELQMLLIRAGAVVGNFFGVFVAYGTLSAIITRADGTRVDLGPLGMRVVTDAGVAFLVDSWDLGVLSISDMNFHDSGTGAVAEAAADTTLGTQAGPTTRATGTKSQPSANILRSIGTIAYVSTLGITEHGLFDQAAQGGTLWDRTVFTVINVISGDSIQFTYDCTLTAGS